MTVPNTNITSGPFVGTGLLDTYDYDFGITAKTEIRVFETTDLDVETELTVDVDFTLTGIGDDAGGTVTRVAGVLPTDYQWFMRSNIALTQETDLNSQGGFFPEVHEAAFDKLTRLVQQLNDINSRSLVVSESYTGNLPLTLPDPEAFKFVRWLSDLSGMENVDLVGSGLLVESDVVEKVNNILGLINVSSPVSGKVYEVLGYFAVFPQAEFSGGGLFIWQADLNKNLADGLVIFDPDNTGGFDGTQSTLGVFLAEQGNGVGVGCWVRENQIDVDVTMAGAKEDGTTLDTESIQLMLDTLNRFKLNEELYATDSLIVSEGDVLEGVLGATKVGGVPVNGTWLIYSGISNCLTIDGEWIGFDSRRSIRITDFSILANSAAAAIFCDFLTQSTIERVRLFGNAAAGSIGLKLINSYNNAVRDSSVNKFETGLDISIKATPDDVFSGQTHFDGMDFWDCVIGSSISAFDNVLAQLLLSRCHWKSNTECGLVLEGGNVHTVEIEAGHFEGNGSASTEGALDLWVKSTINNGPTVRAHFNNSGTAYPKVLLDGDRTKIMDGTEFTSGDISITVNGDSNIIGRCRHRNCNNPIVIGSGAANTFVARQIFQDTTGKNIDDQGLYTRFEGEVTIETEIDLSENGTALARIFEEAEMQFWIHSVTYVNETAITGGAPDLHIGKSTQLTEYDSSTLGTGQFARTKVFGPDMSAVFVQDEDILTLYTSTVGRTGRVRVQIRMVPWNFT